MQYIIEIECESRDLLSTVDNLLNKLGWKSTGTARRWTGQPMNSEDIGYTLSALGTEIENLRDGQLISLIVKRSI